MARDRILAAVEIVAVLLALAALVVSYASLHLTALKRADIWVEYADTEYQVVRGPGFIGPLLNTPQHLSVPVRVANLGGSGFLENLELVELVYKGSDRPLWTGITPEHGTRLGLPLALERGDVRAIAVGADLTGTVESPADAAERVRGLGPIQVTIRWTYLRAGGSLRSLLPGRGAVSDRVTRDLAIELDTGGYRDEVLAHWRHRKEWHDLFHAAGGSL